MYDIVETLVEVATARGKSPAQTALAYLLGRPAVTSVIIGAGPRNNSPTISARPSGRSPKKSAPRWIRPAHYV